MHYYGERCSPLCLPGSGFVTETLHARLPHPEAFANTCHPLSITKGPVPRWQSCPQPLPTACPTPAAGAVLPLPRQPLVQRCVLLCPEPCETTRLLPRREPGLRCSSVAQAWQRCEGTRADTKRVARSLPPCAPRCPEPGRLRFPPCGIRYSASCKGQCRAHKAAKASSRCREPRALPGLTSGYSLPLRGVTECPPQQSITRSFLQECLGTSFPQHRCSKGYPTQECITTYASEQRLSPRSTPAKGAKECPPQKEVKEVTKCSLPQERAKPRSCSAQHLSKSRCLHARGAPRSSHHPSAGAKRSSHTKKSRCAARCLW